MTDLERDMSPQQGGGAGATEAAENGAAVKPESAAAAAAAAGDATVSDTWNERMQRTRLICFQDVASAATATIRTPPKAPTPSRDPSGRRDKSTSLLQCRDRGI